MFPETIKSPRELFAALDTIRFHEKLLSEAIRKGILTRAGIEHIQDQIIEKKRAARKYLRKEREAHDDQPQWVLRDGEYMITREPLPKNLTDADQADAWFRDNEYIPLRYSAYDCTGQIFTRWYKIVERNGRFQVYHATCIDC